MNNQKFLRLLRTTALLTVFSLFAAITFESFHANHETDCHEEDCPICLVLQIIHNTKKIGYSIAASPVEFTSIFYINTILFSALLLAPATLVKQKVKLII